MTKVRMDMITLGFILFIFVLIFSLGVNLYYVHDRSETIKEIERDIDDITVYLDGVEVSYESIDINYYNVSYDRENKIVRLTKPITRHNTNIPIPIPIVR